MKHFFLIRQYANDCAIEGWFCDRNDVLKAVNTWHHEHEREPYVYEVVYGFRHTAIYLYHHGWDDRIVYGEHVVMTMPMIEKYLREYVK